MPSHRVVLGSMAVDKSIRMLCMMHEDTGKMSLGAKRVCVVVTGYGGPFFIGFWDVFVPEPKRLYRS